MRVLVEPLRKSIESKCNIVINSPEAKDHADTKTLAEDILKEINSRTATNMKITLVKKDIEEKQRTGKSHLRMLAMMAVEGSHMLESIKPDAEADPKNLKIKTKLDKLGDAKLLEECEIINAELLRQKAKLLEYGYKEEQIGKLSNGLAQMTNIKKELTATNLSYSEIRSQKESMDKGIMERLDKLNQKIEINKVLMPNLFRDYFAVKLVTAKKQQSGISGTVLFDKQPLANASIKLYTTSVAKARKKASSKPQKASAEPQEKLVYDKLSNSNGEINIRDLKPGTYRLVVSKNGYKIQVFTIYVNPKEFSLVKVEMEKL
ncbi:carboxypeptidase-like regulatory domain-containing protein [uncultured Acetobacteroides sp.]|uniref:carboxypeptidase-like regulatory domain-containing protein n=1 Tax=uncultured Acetobacteroides sp. TaxID=1760811 RepID=UPI0029F562C5|nr:carboxypeptidase-like regulatory domain-containing protein [uncultured Acetobacteroides sp.]